MKTPNTDESTNFFKNIYFIADDTGYGITKLEDKVGVGHGYCSIGLKRNSSPTLRTAKRISDAVGFTIDELMLPPKEFRKVYDND